jgi:hypothetical protein
VDTPADILFNAYHHYAKLDAVDMILELAARYWLFSDWGLDAASAKLNVIQVVLASNWKVYYGCETQKLVYVYRERELGYLSTIYTSQ